MNDNERLMRQAVDACRAGIAQGQSPFGALVATSAGEVVCAVHNSVRRDCDPTAHAEINAIREASRRLQAVHLTGHVIVSTCEPCPMCAAAIHWARFDKLIYGAGIADARQADFNELPVAARRIFELGESPVVVVDGILRDTCRDLFDEWRRGPNPTPY